MKGKLILVLVAAGLLSGCFSPMVFTKPGVSHEQLIQDLARCKTVALTAVPSAPAGYGPQITTHGMEGAIPIQEARQIQAACMEGKGYALSM